MSEQRDTLKSVAGGVVTWMLALGLCFVFAAAVLWATGWAALLPEPVRRITAWGAAVAFAGWLIFGGVLMVREYGRLGLDRLTVRLEERRRRQEVREGKRTALYGPKVP